MITSVRPSVRPSGESGLEAEITTLVFAHFIITERRGGKRKPRYM